MVVAGRTIRDQHHRTHQRIRARVEHLIAPLKTDKYCVNAGVDTPSTTASKSSPDSGTSRPTPYLRGKS
jgi:hypothetical protein